MSSFTFSAAIGVALGFLFGVGCASAVLYTLYLAGYRAALRDAHSGGQTARYRNELRKIRPS